MECSHPGSLAGRDVSLLEPTGKGQRGRELSSEEITGSANCLQGAGALVPGKHRRQDPP